MTPISPNGPLQTPVAPGSPPPMVAEEDVAFAAGTILGVLLGVALCTVLGGLVGLCLWWRG